MSFQLQAVAMVVSGVVRVGPLRLPVYGVWAAVGLIAALWVSQRTAKLVGLGAETLWDAGMFGVVVAFVASRVLLVVEDPKAFLRLPMVVLALPSLTGVGMAITVAAVVVYLRQKKMPLLAVMDAWAPCACVLAAGLCWGHWAEGSEIGMPTAMPWGVVAPGYAVLGRVQPVQMMGIVASLGLGAGLMGMLVLRRRVGETAAVGLVVGGVLAFGLDMLRVPGAGAWLEPGQWWALGAVVVGGILWKPRSQNRDLGHPDFTGDGNFTGGGILWKPRSQNRDLGHPDFTGDGNFTGDGKMIVTDEIEEMQ